MKKKSAAKKPVKVIMYLHVDRGSKSWVKALCRKQVGRVSQSTMVQRILSAAQKNPRFLKAVNAVK